MKKISLLMLGLSALFIAGCENTSENNGTLEYDTLAVCFAASGDIAWTKGDAVGIISVCTRDGVENVSMSVNANARYEVAADGTNQMLVNASDDDLIVATADDHNIRFYAYYPWSADMTDLTAIPVSVSPHQTYGSAAAELRVASKTVTTVIPTVEMPFKSVGNLFSKLVFLIPDDLLDPAGGSVVKSMKVRPAEAANFTGRLTVSGVYNLVTDEFSETQAAGESCIEVDFGPDGLPLESGYTRVEVVVAPFTIPEGGLEVELVDASGYAQTFITWDDKVGTEVAAGTVPADIYLTNGPDDGIIPVTFPVVFPLGDGAFTTTSQPRWVSEGYWSCPDQTQAYCQWHKESDPSPAYTQKLETVNSGAISSPGVKGVWTGDYFEFVIPVRKFAAGTRVNLQFPMYTRQGPVFWGIKYLDGGEWKMNYEKDLPCYDPAYTFDATFSLRRGGKIIEHTMTFQNEVNSGELRFRIECLNGRIQASADTTVIERDIPYTDANGYGAPFYFYLENSDVKAVTFSID